MTDDLKFKIVRVINVLASKNNAEIRGMMKVSKLFDFRDTLLLELLNSEIQTAESMQFLQQISLEALASSERFRSTKTIESLLDWIIQSKTLEMRKGFLEILQKQVCKSSENLKYIGKITEDNNFADIISKKSLLEIDQYIEKNKPKGFEKIIKASSNKKSEKRAELTKFANDRSQRRTKTFAEINKEKSLIQEVIQEYEKQEDKDLGTIGPHIIGKRLEELQAGSKKMIDDMKMAT